MFFGRITYSSSGVSGFDREIRNAFFAFLASLSVSDSDREILLATAWNNLRTHVAGLFAPRRAFAPAYA